ncbi:hypothetical protein EAG_02775 [Camponotus floridanus]|uniref:Uncharacterized protein n=1 Tax=Camponotus floridanus TaxID=104421 RepID=E2AHP1_CAMFO|nr:hypothetical protein EAG_02775 [Camponotus floridanus]
MELGLRLMEKENVMRNLYKGQNKTFETSSGKTTAVYFPRSDDNISDNRYSYPRAAVHTARMLWHRRPIQPRPDAASLRRVQQAANAKYDDTQIGALNLDDETNLCTKCYSRLRTTIIIQKYRYMQKHFFVNGHTVTNEYCSSCGAIVTKISPVDECVSCITVGREFLDALSAEALSLDDYDYPLVLDIHNRTPMP